MNESFIEKSLFGGEKEKGLLRSGSDFTLFIKDLECLEVFLQDKLLFFLLNNQNEQFLPRLICSAKENFSEDVKKEIFSPRLFDLLSKDILVLPSLSERKEIFLSHFLF